MARYHRETAPITRPVAVVLTNATPGHGLDNRQLGLRILMTRATCKNTLKYPGSAKGCEVDSGMTLTTDQENAVLDRIIGERRSCRKFTEKVPTDEQVEGILHAGLHAPFAAAAVGNSEDYFRRFVVYGRVRKP